MQKRNLSIIDRSASGGKTFCILPALSKAEGPSAVAKAMADKSAFCISGGGFTLIEILVSLVIVSVAFSAVLQFQLHSLKIEQKAHILQLFRFETERLYALTQRAQNERQLMELLATGSLCRVKSEPLGLEMGTNRIMVIKHELAAKDGTSLSAEFFTHVPDCWAGKDRLVK